MSHVPPAIRNRVRALGAKPTYSPEQLAFLQVVSTELARSGQNIEAALPPPDQYDTGRMIAALDALRHALDVFAAAVSLAPPKP